MSIRFEYLCYRRKFLRPLATAHGEWHWREGIVIRLEDVDGSVGFGEIAPVPWFGTETVEQALQWCKEVPPEITGALQVPTELPCCGFALSAALEHRSRSASRRTFPVAGLITSSSSLEEKQADGFSTFKVKIGLHSIEEETRLIAALVGKLTPGQRLRLDANGGLSESAYSAWLEFLEGQPVEFLEQPLSPGLENRMLEMAEPFSVPLALDESVAGSDSLVQWSTWPGPLVVKPSLLGNPQIEMPTLALGSSVFETAFGFEAGLQFLARHQKTDTAIGYDTGACLEKDGWALHQPGPQLTSGDVSIEQLQELWEVKVNA